MASGIIKPASGGSASAVAIPVVIISGDTTLTRVVGEVLYRFTATAIATVPLISTWAGWVPHFVMDVGGGGETGTIRPTNTDTFNDVNDDLVLSAKGEEAKLYELTSTTAHAQRDFVAP